MIYSLLIIAFLSFVLSSSSFVSARSTGSPKCFIRTFTDITMGCKTNAPNEGWVVTPSTTTYTPGESMTFTITSSSGKTSFIGFLAFVEKADGTQVGTFSSVNGDGTTITGNFPSPCAGTGTALTHSSSAAKSVPYARTWTAPAAGTGEITAYFTILTRGDGVCPFQIISFKLTEGSSTTTTPATTTSSTTATTTTTAAGGSTTASSTTTTAAGGSTTSSGTTTTAAGTTTTAAGTTTTTTTTTTTPKQNSANQAGPLMIIIGTMMAMGLAVIKIGF